MEDVIVWYILALVFGGVIGHGMGKPNRDEREKCEDEAIKEFAINAGKEMECPHCNELVDLYYESGASASGRISRGSLIKTDQKQKD